MVYSPLNSWPLQPTDQSVMPTLHRRLSAVNCDADSGLDFFYEFETLLLHDWNSTEVHNLKLA